MVKYYPRLLEGEVLSWIERGYSVVVVGPRRAGKTTLLKHLSEKLGWEYLTLDDPGTLREIEDIKSFLELHGPNFVLDEAQYDVGIGRKLKYAFDVRGAKFIVAGSGSFDIKVRVTGELVGRVARLTLLPLSFAEFVLWKDGKLWKIHEKCREAVKKLFRGENPTFPITYSSRLEELWKEYVVFGGYPEVVLIKEGNLKTETLRNIISTYIDRDIVGFLGVREYTKFMKLVSFLANIVSSPLVKATAQQVATVSYQTLEGYLSLLLLTHIVHEVRPLPLFKASLRRASKFYFIDQGILNAFRGDFRPFEVRNDRGVLLENYVARQLLEYTDRIYFYRSEAGGEVDFIINEVPIEVKASGKPGRALYNLAKKLGSRMAVVVRPGELEERNGVIYLPPWCL